VVGKVSPTLLSPGSSFRSVHNFPAFGVRREDGRMHTGYLADASLTRITVWRLVPNCRARADTLAPAASPVRTVKLFFGHTYCGCPQTIVLGQEASPALVGYDCVVSEATAAHLHGST
jgi:hypothetical protein